jgi:CheY-like chemotaxis protein
VRVLIVDDDPDIRSSMRTVLEEFGDQKVCEASNRLEALEHLRASTEPFVVLLDLLMPRLDCPVSTVSPCSTPSRRIRPSPTDAPTYS